MKIQRKRIILIVCVFLAVSIGLTLFFIFRVPSAEKVFNENSRSVVEIKAENTGGAVSFGTAEVWDSSGKLITNAHVVTMSIGGATVKFEKYSIRFMQEEDYRDAELKEYDLDLDLAILRIKDTKDVRLKPITKGRKEKIKVGDSVYAMGNLANYGISLTQGSISIPSIEVAYEGNTRTVIQCNITISGGNSGGALLDKRGKLIGITTFRIKDNSGNVIYGIAYCIPIDIVCEYVNK